MANTHQPHTVSVRQHWKDAWTVTPYLYADSFTRCMAPAMSSAQFSYRYGDILRPDLEAFDYYAPQDLLNWYVKIELQQGGGDAITWYGVVIDNQKVPQGANRTDDNAPAQAGDQSLTAVGLEYLLEREPILTSVVEYQSGEKIVNRALTFNPIRHLGSGFKDRAYEANRSKNLGSKDAYIFAETLRSGYSDPWTALDVVAYLLEYQTPKDGNGVSIINWTIEDVEAISGLEYEVRDLRVSEKDTVFKLLNRLISRQRGMGWSLSVDSDIPTITVHSLAVDAVDIPAANNGSSSRLPENSSKTAWNFDADGLVHNPSHVESATQQFDQVIVRGARRGAVFTVGTQSGTLIEDWSAAQETAYQSGASAATGYSTMGNSDRERLHILVRSQDALKRVYSYFRLDDAWTGLDYNSNIALPSVSNSAITAPFWRPGLRFAKYLPLFTDHDYSGSKIGSGAVTTNTPDGAIAEYMRPLVIIKDDKNYYWLAEGFNSAASVEQLTPDSAGHSGFHGQMQDYAPGVIVKVSGFGQHGIAKGSFTPYALDANDKSDLYTKPVIDYSTAIYATVFVEFDDYLTASYPADPVTPQGDAVRKLIIDMPELRQDRVCKDTIVGIDANGAVIKSDGGYVRDDTYFASAIATLAWQWYGQPRRVLNLTRHSLILASGIDVGTMVTTIGAAAETVNTVVSRLVFDTRAGTVNYLTQFSEFDLSGL